MRRPTTRPLLALAACLAWAAVPAAAQPTGPAETLAANAPRTTPAGHGFTAPEGFTLRLDGEVLRLTPPEGDTLIAIVDLDAADGDEALARAWTRLRPEGPGRAVRASNPLPARDGWEERRAVTYETSPNERRVVQALVRRAGAAARQWQVVLIDGSEPTLEKRGAPIGLALSSLRPKGFEKESFAGRRPRPIDAAMVAQLRAFLEDGMRRYDVPGLAFSLIDGNRVVHEGGLGVKALGRPGKVDANTLFIAASNTKSMTTLLMAQAVDRGLMRWDDPVQKVYPAFGLGDPELAKQLQVRHLVCACTGMPRQDMPWIFEFGRNRPADTFTLLSHLKPTSRFGEVFQYSNLMVGAGGYVAAALLAPGQELGAAYDRQMRERIFAPLGMRDTTFDFRRALAGNVALPHGDGLDGRSRPAAMDLNHAIVPVRPAGGVWTSAHDMSRYVLMELARGVAPDGTRIVSEANLLAREQPQVAAGEDVAYGLGLFVNKRYGIDIVSHGGDLLGYHSNMVWLPQFGIGFTILTNSDSGVFLRGPLQRKLLELLFDGRPEADAQLAAGAANRLANLAKERQRLALPADAKAAAGLASRYVNAELGAIDVRRRGADRVFDFGEWKSAVATRRNDDGTTSFITVDPGVIGFDFVAGQRDGRRTLVMRDAQHEFVFVEAPPARRPQS